MLTGKDLAHASMINAQKHFGLDVLTRITYELEHPEDGVEKLQKALVNSINEMIEDICCQSEVSKEWIYEIAVGANCTMMHMLLGVPATSLGRSPYAPVFVRGKDIKAKEIGLCAAEGARLYCLPSVSAYIGADIVAGAYVCQLQKESGNVLFIDIGTNGEIVLSSHGRLLCCSCAAGPALEGMNISSGMRAAEGAIEDVTITESGIEWKVIGNEKPIGICGSGILAVVKVQLAKGAILSGFLALLKKAGIQMEDLDKVMIAGQFGAHLPADSLVGTGIIPKEVQEKLVYVGNSSKTGAYMALMSAKVKREMEELAGQMDYMELGATENYERLFSECLIFPNVK